MKFRTVSGRWLLVLLMLCAGVSAEAGIPDFMARFHKMVQQAYANSGELMKYATSKGAVLTPMADGNGLYLLWKLPSNPKIAKKMIVVLPDAGSDAYREFRFWHPMAEKYGYALAIPQWRSGLLDPEGDLVTPSQLNATTVQPILIANGVEPSGAVLYGRGRNADALYGITALDHRDAGGHFIGTVIADDADADFNASVIRQINGGGLGRRVFDRSQWILYCSTDCKSMERTASWVLFQGGKVEWLIQEPEKAGRALRDDPDLLEKRLEPFLKRL